MITAIPKCPSGKSRSQERIEAAAAQAKHWEQVKKAVEHRDGRQCRLCGKGCSFGASSLATKADPHHIIFQSAQGPDSTGNVLKLCRSCHDDVHVHRRVMLSGDADELNEFGNPGMVKVEKLEDGGYRAMGFI